MKSKKMRTLFLLSALVLVLIVLLVPAAMSVDLNDNVNVAGELFLDGNGCGVTYPDGTRQTTASSPPWSQKIAAEDRFELVLPIMMGLVKVYEAVLDRETGLVWQRNTSETTYEWHEAQAYCYNATIGGRKGWRLPTVEELATLVDPSKSNPSLPDGHPFLNRKSSYYWSSTTRADNTVYAWLVNFLNGNVGSGNKSVSYYVRAVRSGQ